VGDVDAKKKFAKAKALKVRTDWKTGRKTTVFEVKTIEKKLAECRFGGQSLPDNTNLTSAGTMAGLATVLVRNAG